MAISELAPGSTFAGHRIEAVAGRGGMGVVYRARQLNLDRDIALKLITPALADDAEFRERFTRESRLAASIDHPNVIPVYYADEHDELLYIAMRYVEGDDLRTLLRREGRLMPERTAHIVSQVAAALDAAHAKGLVHRDIKPANVLLAAGDHAYLTDFGLTRRVASEVQLSRPGQWVGTVGYIAPEQIRGDRVDARADIYALGCVLFHTLVGHEPYPREGDEARLWAHLHAPPPSAHAEVPDVPEAFDEVIARAMAKDRDERYRSAGDLGRAALAAVGAQPPVRERGSVAVGAAALSDEDETRATPAQNGETAHADTAVLPGRRRRRGLVVGAGAAVAALVAGGIAALVLTSGSSDDRPAPSTTATRPEPSAGTVSTVSARTGSRPNGVALAGGSAWVISSTDTRLTRITMNTNRRLHGPSVAAGSSAIAARSGGLWVANGKLRSLQRLDIATGAMTSTVSITPGVPVAVATGSGSVWVGSRSGFASTVPQRVTRVDPDTGQIVGTRAIPLGVQDLAVGEGAVWVTSRRGASNRVTRWSLTTNRLTTIPSGRAPGGIDVGAGAVWVADREGSTVTRIDPDPPFRRTTIRVGRGATDVAVGKGVVWVANRADGTVSRIDPATNRVVGKPVRVGAEPFALAARGSQAWVTCLGDDVLVRVTVRA